MSLTHPQKTTSLDTTLPLEMPLLLVTMKMFPHGLHNISSNASKKQVQLQTNHVLDNQAS
jgi:hypothetical protein